MSLRVEGLVKEFPFGSVWRQQKGVVHALRGVDFTVEPGETLAIVGESGCGKSTLAKCLVGLLPLTAGRVTWKGRTFSELGTKVQMVFQDPFSSLNPRLTIEEILSEPLRLSPLWKGKDTLLRVRELLQRVGLPETVLYRFPHEMSGGQRQRVGIARALALDPEILICDEPVSALDVSIQAQILNLFLTLQKQLNLTMIFITHDLRVASVVSQKVAVFYLGEIVEMGRTQSVFSLPQHPYTQSLMGSIPGTKFHREGQKPLEGEPPSPVNLPVGCSFYSRCPVREQRCERNSPSLKPAATQTADHAVACWPAQEE